MGIRVGLPLAGLVIPSRNALETRSMSSPFSLGLWGRRRAGLPSGLGAEPAPGRRGMGSRAERNPETCAAGVRCVPVSPVPLTRGRETMISAMISSSQPRDGLDSCGAPVLPRSKASNCVRLSPAVTAAGHSPPPPPPASRATGTPRLCPAAPVPALWVPETVRLCPPRMSKPTSCPDAGVHRRASGR